MKREVIFTATAIALTLGTTGAQAAVGPAFGPAAKAVKAEQGQILLSSNSSSNTSSNSSSNTSSNSSSNTSSNSSSNTSSNSSSNTSSNSSSNSSSNRSR